MKDTKQRTNILSLLVYELKTHPKYYQIKKSFFKSILIGLPLVTLISVLGIISLIIYFKEIRTITVQKVPPLVKRLKSEKSDLSLQITQKENLIQQIQNRLATNTNNVKSSSPLTVYNPVNGQQDLTKTPALNIEQLKIYRTSNNTINLDFRLVNLTPNNKRISGFATVIMKTSSSIHFYPPNILENDSFNFKFTSGESFTTARFRPFAVRFSPIIEAENEIIFKILVFSRTGDIIFHEIINHVFR